MDEKHPRRRIVTINLRLRVPCVRLPFLYRCVLALRLVEELAAGHSSDDLAQQQPLLLLDLLQHALVLLCASRKIWQDFVNRTIGDVLVGRVSSLTCGEWRISQCLDGHTQNAYLTASWCNHTCPAAGRSKSPYLLAKFQSPSSSRWQSGLR